MKKMLSVALALLMLSGVLMLSACSTLSDTADEIFGKEEETVSLVGTWEGTVDMTTMFGEAFETELTSVTGNVTVTFKDDGTYRVAVDAASLNASLAAALDITLEDMDYLGIGYTGEETKGEYSYENNVLILDADEAQCELTADTLKITDDSGTSYDLTKTTA